MGFPKEGDLYGNGVPIVVVGVPTYQGGREGRPQGEGASFLANVREMWVQSTRFILRVCSDHAPSFTKKRLYLCSVYFPRSSDTSVGSFMCSVNELCPG